MLKVIFLRPGNMVVLCLIEKEVSLILVLDPNFEYKKINEKTLFCTIFTRFLCRLCRLFSLFPFGIVYTEREIPYDIERPEY